MNIDISQIVADKLAQMEAEGTIQRKIEETLEKTLLDAISSELNSYSLKNDIQKQVKESVSKIAADCGFSAYNGFIAQTVKNILQQQYNQDITEKVQKALDTMLLQRHENVRLSDIFKQYRKWVLEATDYEEKCERETFTMDLEIRRENGWAWYTCRFADRPIEYSVYGSRERPDIEMRICVWEDSNKKAETISGLYINGHELRETIKIGVLSDFEAFLVNLYYTETPIILDPEDVPDDNDFDIDI